MLPVHTFLVLDDDEDMRFLLHSELLKEFPGSNVLECACAADALDRCLHSIPDLILTDYSLPDGDGIEFITALRERNTTCPVVMLTGSSDPRVHEQAYTAGATAVVWGTKLRFAPIIRSLLSRGTTAPTRALHLSMPDLVTPEHRFSDFAQAS